MAEDSMAMSASRLQASMPYHIIAIVGTNAKRHWTQAEMVENIMANASILDKEVFSKL